MELLIEEFRQCQSVQAAIDLLLREGLEASQTGLGNVQLMDWRAGHLAIRSQRGFRYEFLKFFERVAFDGGSVCSRALAEREAIIVEDVMSDDQLSCRDVLQRAGVAAVQSTPIISKDGAFLGIISTHFDKPHRPSYPEMHAIAHAARLAADAVLHISGNSTDIRTLIARSQRALMQSQDALALVEKLQRWPSF
jgi:GAF domain-containing protein